MRRGREIRKQEDVRECVPAWAGVCACMGGRFTKADKSPPFLVLELDEDKLIFIVIILSFV